MQIITSVDRGYFSITAHTESGHSVFREVDKAEMELLTSAFDLPNVSDVKDKYPEIYNKWLKTLEKNAQYLFEYQREDLARPLIKPFGYIGYEMGGGKTLTASAYAKTRNYRRVLVVCQSGLVGNWMNELQKFGFKAEKITSHNTISRLGNEKRSGKKPSETTFYVTSYEFLGLDGSKRYHPWECVKYDADGNILHSEKAITSAHCPACKVEYERSIKECPSCGESSSWNGRRCSECGFVAFAYDGVYIFS